MEDRIIEYFPNWVLWLAIAGFLYWRLNEKMDRILSELTIRIRENLALFADWQRRERQAEKDGDSFDRNIHRRDFMIGAGSYRNAYEPPDDAVDAAKASDEVKKVEELMRSLINHSVNGIIRLRRQKDDEPGSNDLRCIFANEAAGRLLTVGINGLINCSGEEILSIATNGMDSSATENLQSQWLKATKTGESIDAVVSHISRESVKWFRLICEPTGTDVAVTIVDITERKTSDDLKNLELKKLRDRVLELESRL